MNKILYFFLVVCIIHPVTTYAQRPVSHSVYTQKIVDEAAMYFTDDGKADVSDQLQAAINQLKKDRNFGVLFIPEGTYTISKTIYIPAAIRLIGYGKKRPLFVLKKNSPGFQQAKEADKGKASYMFWFTGGAVEDGQPIRDAGAGTFYSALSNIDLKIEEGNPEAVALRTHFAQHSFVSHCSIDIGKGKAGLFDVGNMIEDVQFIGGRYGIYTTKASPGWQFMMLDTYFEGQKEAAIKTQEAGFTIVRMQVKNVPTVLKVNENYWEKLYMEDCRFEQISGPAIKLADEGNANMQLNIRNLYCDKVPVLVHYPKTGEETKGVGPLYQVNRLIYGLQMDDLDAEPKYRTLLEAKPVSQLPEAVQSDVPALPAMEHWANVKEAGAKGDGVTDDAKAIQQAIDQHTVVYVPQGSYRITETIKLKANTVLIGLHPMATNFVLAESAPAFSGFGAPKAIVEAPVGGRNILTGIGLYTGQNNYRAVACKWMAGEGSMVNDVKFIGGHGTMQPGPQVPWKWEEAKVLEGRRNDGFDPAWDTQYWSLWVTQNGGGIFKNIWSANTYATAGFYASDTHTPSKIYAMSVEHHVRNEVRFNKVSNWKVYALQLEEESRESSECQPLEIGQSQDMTFANLYTFRVIRVKVPYPYAIRTWDCSGLELLNVHNYSQIKYTTDNPLYDVNTGIELRPNEFSRLFISGKTTKLADKPAQDHIQFLAKGFEFALGATHDSKGNVYFAEQRMKRIYKWSAVTNSLSLLADFPWEPLSLGTDSEDHLLVVFRYNPQPGRLVNGQQESFSNPADASGTSFSGWGNSGFATWVYSLNPDQPEESIHVLKQAPVAALGQVFKALYPSNRWRDYHDFNQVSLLRNDTCWVAPDGKTIVPMCYDLARSCALVEAFPGKPLYAVDEYDKRTVRYDVDAKTYLSDLHYFAEKGEFSAIPDAQGRVWVADGNLYLYDAGGKQVDQIKVPERPSTLTFGGAGLNTLYMTGRSGLYRLQQ